MRKSLFLAAATLLFLTGPVPQAHAQPESGMLAIGSSDVSMTPVGIRYWASEKVAIDVEVGLWILDPVTDSGDVSSRFKGQLGIPINLISVSDVWLHFRPFVLFDAISFEDFAGTSLDSITNLYFGGALEAEAWLTESLSFSVWHGVVIESLDENGTSSGESETNIHLKGASLGNAGFHFYF